jgi:hypothetical protein
MLAMVSRHDSLNLLSPLDQRVPTSPDEFLRPVNELTIHRRFRRAQPEFSNGSRQPATPEPIRRSGFAKNFARQREWAAPATPTLGENVVDRWGGIRNKQTGETREPDTTVVSGRPPKVSP